MRWQGTAAALLVGCLSNSDAQSRERAHASSERVDAQQAPSPSGLTGDWDGLRSDLHDKGVDVAASYVSQTAWNADGGKREKVTETGQFAVGLTFDAEKTVGLKGGTFQATASFRRGKDLRHAAGLGVLQQVQEVYGRGQTERLTQFWYEQQLAGGAVAIKAGRATVGEDFASFSCYFMNLSFCGSQAGNLAGDYWYNWPVSQWMTRIKVSHGDFYAQAAVYEVNPRNLKNDFTIGKLHGATGVLVPFEVGWTPEFSQNGRVGYYKIGGWYSNANADDVYLDINRQPRVMTGMASLQRSSRSGIWINLQQQLIGRAVAGKPVSGMGVFLNLTQTDRRTSVTDNQVSAGLFWKAIIPSLPNDVLGFAVARTNVNSRAARGIAPLPTNSEVPNAEYASEVYYSLHPFEWLELRPNMQFVHDPGGYRKADDVKIIGLKAGVTL
jgi:porin